jgi:hypothetical protein
VVSFLKFPHQNPIYTSTLPHTCYMPIPPHSSRFDHSKIMDEKQRSLSSSLHSFLHFPVTLSLLSSNILLNNLFYGKGLLQVLELMVFSTSFLSKFHLKTETYPLLHA